MAITRKPGIEKRNKISAEREEKTTFSGLDLE